MKRCIFLMCVKNLETITDKMINEGLNSKTPSAIIRWGTRPEQKVVTGTISEIAKLAKDHKISPPAILVIGEVVSLREKLNWYERKPLYGQRILITRQLTDDYLKLEELGAELFVFPTINFSPPDDFTELDNSIKNIESYNYIVFPSPRAVNFFFKRFILLGRDVRDLKGVLICVLGQETAHTLKNYGINADIIPDKFNAEAVAELFKKQVIHESPSSIRILYPRSDIALKSFAKAMQNAGVVVDAPETYRTVKPSEHAKRLSRFLIGRKNTRLQHSHLLQVLIIFLKCSRMKSKMY